MRVSIIITAFNEEKYIERAIESALAQSYNSIQVIVIDDGSSDDTFQRAEQYTPSIVIHRNSEPTGLMAARNLGISRADGDYITFLDGDDAFHPQKVAKQLAVFSRLPAKSMLFTSRVVYSERGIPRIPMASDISGSLVSFDYNDVLQKRVSSLGATFMMRRVDYVACGCMDVNVGKERDLFARFSFSGGRLFRLSIPLYLQYRKPNSMSTQKEKTYLRETIMMEAWRPDAHRNAHRNITEAEYQAYSESVFSSYKKQFAGSLKAKDVHDRFRLTFSKRVYGYVLQKAKTYTKDAIGMITYLKFRKNERELLARSIEFSGQ